ncbi:dihydropteroate synthase [Actinoallomurus oryzae]|uniref:dihydropteroate synthase n=1 Tax=Actinoallomurus oryzae TaxID=502180 RepID=UPI003CD08C34
MWSSLASLLFGRIRLPPGCLFQAHGFEKNLRRVQAACDAGIHADRSVIAPGLGFAKTPEHSWTISRDLDELTCFGLPGMVGVSRKRMLAELRQRHPCPRCPQDTSGSGHAEPLGPTSKRDADRHRALSSR